MFGHPRGLKTLFFTEMWERLSYYGMRALLVLFLVDSMEGGFGMSAETAGAIYGMYTALVYLLALPGGWIADRLLGLRRSVLIGGCVIAAGHFSMAIPSATTFYLGLILIVIGTGLLKPNISAMVGDLYPEGGARRDAGFSIYYMGINIGALIGPLVCGYLGEKVNWHLGFSAAGIGMVFGVIQYALGARHLPPSSGKVKTAPEEYGRALRKFVVGVGIVLSVILLLALGHLKAWFPLSIEKIAGATGVFIVLVAMIYFTSILIFGHWSKLEKKRILVILVLFFTSAVFWSGFEQAGSSMNLFANEYVDLNVLGWEMPASWLQSVNPLFIILLAPVFGWLWIWLGTRQPSIPVKFSAGLLIMGTGFLVLAWGSQYASDTTKVSSLWLIITYFLHTSGELCLSPVGMSSVTKLSPRPLVGQMMGLWFTATALGNLMAGQMGGLFETLPLPKLFGSVFVIASGAGIILLLISRPIRRLMGDVK